MSQQELDLSGPVQPIRARRGQDVTFGVRLRKSDSPPTPFNLVGFTAEFLLSHDDLETTYPVSVDSSLSMLTVHIPRVDTLVLPENCRYLIWLINPDGLYLPGPNGPFTLDGGY